MGGEPAFAPVGPGLAAARRFAPVGHTVTLIFRNARKWEELTGELTRDGTQA